MLAAEAGNRVKQGRERAAESAPTTGGDQWGQYNIRTNRGQTQEFRRDIANRLDQIALPRSSVMDVEPTEARYARLPSGQTEH